MDGEFWAILIIGLLALVALHKKEQEEDGER